MIVEEDAAIKQEVIAHLDWDPRIRIEDVSVTVRDREVHLGGSARSYAEKWAATEAARSIVGVRNIVNEIAVQPLGRSDEELRKDVIGALEWDVRIDPKDIEVEVKDGVVTLKGKVLSLPMLDAAVEDATWTRGVVDVVNDLAVMPIPTRHDNDIVMDLVGALTRDAVVHAPDIQVKSSGGVVILDGVVDRAQAKYAAEVNARLTRGVRGVINNILVAQE